MGKRLYAKCIAGILALMPAVSDLCALPPAGHGGSEASVYIIDIRQEINRTAQIYLRKGLDEAQATGADVVLIHLNTYGGLLDAADSMRTAILYSPVPVDVFIDNNAASAGALVSLACRKIYMRRGAGIGAATVVDGTSQALPDKYQSYMRALMRATAEAHGRDTVVDGRDTTIRWRRDPRIAEAMVDRGNGIPNLVDSGRTLTLTAEEAVKWGFCDGLADSKEEVVERLMGYESYRLTSFRPSWSDDLRGFLMNPVVQSILILLIVGGIYFELQSPGIGFPLLASVVAAVLYFSPLYIEGLAENWEILLFVLGVGLVAVEIFVIPGFGVTGICGIMLAVAGFFLSLIRNIAFDFSGVRLFDTGRAVAIVVSGIMLGSLAMLWLSDRIGKKGVLNRMALAADLEGAVSTPVPEGLEGKEGVADTVLRPSGKVLIDGRLYDGISESGFIERGTAVRVTRFESAQVYVERVSRS
ncbi:MAG: nodulation protein NfeD [Tannerella sp.]|jgi:membrane-bound serine protease (ClpP class)|nr:nodulation protein NfeD [Tannerella sp.]